MNTSILGPVAALGAMGLALWIATLDRAPQITTVGDPAAWATAIEQARDHITATELAALLGEEPAGAVVIDVRPAAEFALFHLPRSINLDVPTLIGEDSRTLLDSLSDRLVVLCSNGMTHPAQAWVELVRQGRTNVRVLEDGLDGFVRDVLTPPSLRPGAQEATARAEFAAFAAARARFLPSPTATTSSTPKPARIATYPPTLTEPAVVSPTWVERRGEAILLIDTRDKPEDFALGHLPRALHVPTKHLRGTRGGLSDELLPPAELATALGALGITADTELVAYGGDRLQDPTHFVLALVRLGHRKIAVLEGGLPAWLAEGRALTTELRVPEPTTYVPRATDGLAIAELAEVAAASKSSAARILDVRPAEAFRGEGKSTEARAGHVPGSLNRPYTVDLDRGDAGVFWRPLDALAEEYATMGLSKEQPVIVMCRTGHQASQTWFTLRFLLGYQDVRWYDGSWTEWALHDELPVATGNGGGH